MWATRIPHNSVAVATSQRPARVSVLRPLTTTRQQRRRTSVTTNAQEKAVFLAKEALKVGTSVVETAAGFVPESVPRPAAKGIVAVGSLVIFGWIFQKVLSTIVTIVLLVGGAWLWISASSKDDGGSGGGSSASTGDDDEDPVAQARRIMDKYK